MGKPIRPGGAIWKDRLSRERRNVTMGRGGRARVTSSSAARRGRGTETEVSAHHGQLPVTGTPNSRSHIRAHGKSTELQSSRTVRPLVPPSDLSKPTTCQAESTNPSALLRGVQSGPDGPSSRRRAGAGRKHQRLRQAHHASALDASASCLHTLWSLRRTVALSCFSARPLVLYSPGVDRPFPAVALLSLPSPHGGAVCRREGAR